MSTVDWDALPEPVRGRLVDYAANALSDLPKVDIPQRLRPVARFAPAKRARVAAAAMLAALRDISAFRAAVLAWLTEHRADALDTAGPDVVATAAAAVLTDADDVEKILQTVSEHVQEAGLRAERDAALARIERLEVELERARAQLRAARETQRAARSERKSDLERLRGRLREQGVELRKARDAERTAQEDLIGTNSAGADEVATLTSHLARERQRADAERTRAERAMRDAETARRSAREAREADEVRLSLLLDTLAGVSQGLRAELGLARNGTPDGERPADTVERARRGGSAAWKRADPAALDQLLALPNVHVIVDGYNVTKTGYPELALADQRERLGRQLAALAARTSAEVTVVYDGAAVVAVPVAALRGVRVLFSDPGVPADDVIRDLVAAEPAGRPVVVVTSDREIVDAVRDRGAHAVPSGVLVTRLVRV
ncbi:MAG: NYN domain-containing protein [Pseudonocardiaceae bacterium]